MARIRTIKPEFWTDEKVVELSPLARLVFIGLWNFSDEQGRMSYSPKRLKMQVLPSDDADMCAVVGEIEREGLVITYSVDGKDFLQVCGFEKHQKTDARYPSKLPPPPTPADSRRKTSKEKGREREKEGESKSAPNGAPAIDLKKAPSSQPAQTKTELEDGSDEARFWAMAPACQAKGVARSQLGRLANVLSGDFEDGIGILDAVLDAREPRSFLAAVIRDRGGGAKSRDGPKRPGFVEDAARDGFDVEPDGENWIIGGEIYDQQGEKIGW